MSNDSYKGSGRRVPRGRLSRLGHFGRLAGGVAGGMLAEGARRLADGERPRMRDMLLTPGNINGAVERLSHLRGAAMKLGQMISLDAGDMLPAELSQIMARLRENAHHMPPAQLNRVLAQHWGKDWRTRFARFEPRPIAAASIGQVHRALTHDGRELAIKVQYPGVRESIDADVDNVATLLRMSGLMPRELDIASLLAEAKRQLAEEADYEREGAQMTLFGELLADTPDVVVPELDREFTTDRVLAMTFLPGRPIESLETAPQETRDEVMRRLITLVLRELFEFGVMQTDPNFANYRYQPDTGRLVLLDFGAARPIDPATVEGYRGLLRAGLSDDRVAIRDAAIAAGFVGEAAIARHGSRVDRMIEVIAGELNRPGPFDFGDRRFVGALRDEGMEIAADKASWHLPPTDILFAQRKISGTAMIGVGDMWIVGRLGDAPTQGAVDIGARLFAMLFVVMNFLKTGTTGLVAQAGTRQGTQEQAAVLMRGLAVGLAIACALLAAKPLLLPALLAVLGAEGEVLGAARVYAEIRYWSAPAVMANFALVGFLVGRRQMRAVLAFEVAYNLLNLALGAWLALGLDWGIAGIGWSSFIAEVAKLAAVGAFILAGASGKALRTALLERGNLRWAELRPFLSVNRDLFLRTVVLMVALAALTRLSAERGVVSLAANGIFYQLFVVTALLLDGFENAAQVLNGERLGARDREGFTRYIGAMLWRGLGVALVLSALFALVAGPVIDSFAATPEIAAMGRQHAIWLAVIPVAGFAAFVYDGVFVGASWTRALLGSMIGAAALYAALLWLTWPLGNDGLWLSFAIFLAARAVFQAVQVRRLTARSFPA